jgi:ketosteroid isomerase-like protein
MVVRKLLQPMGTADLDGWIRGYRAAWESNDPVAIGALFAEDAVYYTEPAAEPWRSRAEIVAQWLARRDEPGDATFEWTPLVNTPGLAVITGRTVYRSGDDYDNLWVIRFDDDGLCCEFTEWWMRRSAG